METFIGFNQPFKKKEESHKSVFINEDKPVLMPLPTQRYELIDVKLARVNIDYHIEYDHKYYSVSYKYIGQKVEVKTKPLVIEVWHNNERICTHSRSYKNLYTTIPEHILPRPTFITFLGGALLYNFYLQLFGTTTL